MKNGKLSDKAIILIVLVLISTNYVASQVIHLETYKSEFVQISYLGGSEDVESINMNLEKPAFLFHNISDSELKIESNFIKDNFKTVYARNIDETDYVSETKVYKAFSESDEEYMLGIARTKNGESFTKHIHSSHRFMLAIGDISITFYCIPAK